MDTSSNGEAYQIYLPDNKNKAFYIKYRLKNMAIIHNDIAEIYWNAIGDSLSESIGTLRITVTFPGNENEAMDKVYSMAVDVISKIEDSIKH